MLRRSFRIGLMLGLIGAAAFALSKLLGSQSSEPLALPAGSGEPWPRLTSDPAVAAPPIARAVPDPETLRPFERPTDGVCPTTHPIKAKLKSKIYHLPGMANYERMKPDRCYLDVASAEADGFRQAMR